MLRSRVQASAVAFITMRIEKQRILDIGESAHRIFIDRMYPRFGLDDHPEYASLEVLPMIFSGGFDFNPDTIYFNDTHSGEEVIYETAYHESAHTLHQYSRKLYYKVGREEFLRTVRQLDKRLRFKDDRGKIMRGRVDILEIIADFGAISFLSEYPGQERVAKYLEGRSDVDTDLAEKLHSIDPALLLLLSQSDFNEAIEIIRGVVKP